ncbi:MAG: TerC family protein [Acidimicrobiales bacterium]|nr:TerC family protein [Acidimicrobiaceae bacterium]MXX44412.1 TerC family protein [Acidimicrobiales bacterium]MXZ15334.1 TerC family protein [Acidimicrobiales bacterium]MYD32306.1 TerC family protein [Acidimicrobiales bacterium]MYG60619.1 TerC family protein [Acidimicrobiales bacterium]
MDWVANPEVWISLVTLTVLEIVLGIDNVIFISILAGRLGGKEAERARVVGLSLAMGMRVLLLLGISWIVRLTTPLFSVFGHELSGRDLILLGGGLFLLGKATFEIHHKLEGDDHDDAGDRAGATFTRVIIQILLLDLVFSLDSVITAVGMADRVGVMIAAVVIAVGVMLWSSGPVMRFVGKHPTVKMLALAFLLLIGMSLVAEGAEFHIPKGYIYFAMGFAVLVEALNLRMKRNRQSRTPPVEFHERRMPEFAAASDSSDASDASDADDSSAADSEASG